MQCNQSKCSLISRPWICHRMKFSNIKNEIYERFLVCLSMYLRGLRQNYFQKTFVVSWIPMQNFYQNWKIRRFKLQSHSLNSKILNYDFSTTTGIIHILAKFKYTLSCWYSNQYLDIFENNVPIWCFLFRFFKSLNYDFHSRLGRFFQIYDRR